MADPMKYELSLRLRSSRMEPGSRPIEAWNDVNYDAVRVRAYKRWWIFQLPSERVKDFASRLEGVAHKTFGDSSVESGDMSQNFRAKMILSQFLAGLQPMIKAQIVIINPETFEGAVELRERIEIAQEMLVPNVNVLESGNRVHDQVLDAVQASGDTLAKTLNLVNRQLEHLNSRMDKIEAETKSGNGGNWQQNSSPGAAANPPFFFLFSISISPSSSLSQKAHISHPPPLISTNSDRVKADVIQASIDRDPGSIRGERSLKARAHQGEKM
ncbi:retrotrans_gag domain-containing protein [Caerostris extrusa]|uniref:Retrotrans_gag domain-containing protein n=1 Tax=Caerostris extrusa TaxID=172846 RepID=A0AAV4PHM9_CAEEX|nr:retrotrans_gag domain-containing protein [Caerostris extrusa]